MSSDIISLASYHQKSITNRIGLWLFIISDAFVFIGLFVSRFFLLGVETRPEVNQVVGLIVTSILLLSSFFMNRAEIAIDFGDQKSFKRNILITIILGSIFLVGVVGVEWQIAPFGPSENVIWSLFFVMTGFHAIHVLSGIVLLIIVYLNGRKGLYNEERHFPVEGAAVYWHFVDVVWIFFYPALYLIGQPVL